MIRVSLTNFPSVATTADPDDYWQYDEDEYEYADEYTESENENSNDKNSENPQESTKEELPGTKNNTSLFTVSPNMVHSKLT